MLLITGISVSYSQTDTVIYYAHTGEIARPENAEKYIDTRYKNKRIILTEFIKNKNREWEKYDRKVISSRSDTLYIYKSELYAINDYSPKVAHVKHVMDSIYYLKEYNYEEDLIHEGFYKRVFPKIKHGITIDFYNDGTKRAESMYKNNLIQWSEKWLLNGEKGMDNVYSVVDEEPTYKNKSIREFRNYIMNELILRYDDKGIDGIIIIEFVIMEDGSLKEIQILQSNSEVLANEVVNLITATNGLWSSGKINGKKVRVIKQFPINFISMSN